MIAIISTWLPAFSSVASYHDFVLQYSKVRIADIVNSRLSLLRENSYHEYMTVSIFRENIYDEYVYQHFHIAVLRFVSQHSKLRIAVTVDGYTYLLE
jgi:hypothetical protein